jgi:hypothetical protein
VHFVSHPYSFCTGRGDPELRHRKHRWPAAIFDELDRPGPLRILPFWAAGRRRSFQRGTWADPFVTGQHNDVSIVLRHSFPRLPTWSSTPDVTQSASPVADLEVPTTSSTGFPSSIRVGAITGGIVGCVAVFSCLFGPLLWSLRRRPRSAAYDVLDTDAPSSPVEDVSEYTEYKPVTVAYAQPPMRKAKK